MSQSKVKQCLDLRPSQYNTPAPFAMFASFCFTTGHADKRTIAGMPVIYAGADTFLTNVD